MRPSQALAITLIILAGALFVSAEQAIDIDLSTINHPHPVITVTYYDPVQILGPPSSRLYYLDGPAEVEMDIINTCGDGYIQCETWEFRPRSALDPGQYEIKISSVGALGSTTAHILVFTVSGLEIQLAGPPNPSSNPGAGTEDDAFFTNIGSGWYVSPFIATFRTMYRSTEGVYEIPDGSGEMYARSDARCAVYWGSGTGSIPKDSNGFFILSGLDQLTSTIPFNPLGPPGVTLGTKHTLNVNSPQVTATIICQEYHLGDADGDGNDDDVLPARDTVKEFTLGYFAEDPAFESLLADPELVSDTGAPVTIIRAELNQPGYCTIKLAGTSMTPLEFSSFDGEDPEDFDKYSESLFHIICYKGDENCPKAENDILDRDFDDQNRHEFTYEVKCRNAATVSTQPETVDVTVDFDIPFTIHQINPSGPRVSGSDGDENVVYINVTTTEDPFEVPADCLIGDYGEPPTTPMVDLMDHWLHGYSISPPSGQVTEADLIVSCTGRNTPNTAEKRITFTIDAQPPAAPDVEPVEDDDGNTVVCDGETRVTVLPGEVFAVPADFDYYRYEYQVLDGSTVLSEGAVLASSPDIPVEITADIGSYIGQMTWKVRAIDQVDNAGPWTSATVQASASSSDTCDTSAFIRYFDPELGYFRFAESPKNIIVESKRPATCYGVDEVLAEMYDISCLNYMDYLGILRALSSTGTTSTGGQTQQYPEELTEDIEYHFYCKEVDDTCHETVPALDFGIISEVLAVTAHETEPADGIVKDMLTKSATIRVFTNHDARCRLTDAGQEKYFEGEQLDTPGAYRSTHEITLTYYEDPIDAPTVHTYPIVCEDKVDQSASDSISITVDFSQDFSIEIIQPESSSYIQTQSTTVIAEPEVAVTYCYHGADGTTHVPQPDILMTHNAGQWSFGVGSLDAGAHSYPIYCIDTTTDRESTAYANFNVDLTDPTLEFDDSVTNLCSQMSVILFFDAEDDVEVDHVELEITYPDDTTLTATTTDSFFEIDVTGMFGSLTIDGTVYDKAGRTSTDEITFNLLPGSDPACIDPCGDGVCSAADNEDCFTCTVDCGCAAGENCMLQADDSHACIVPPVCELPEVSCHDGSCVGLSCQLPAACYDGCCGSSGVCENFNSCACPECDGEAALCEEGTVCDYDARACSCVLAPDGICPASGGCDDTDPDCFCGNGIAETEYGEDCDGSDLNQWDCQDLGYYTGTLHCYAPDAIDADGNPIGCTFDKTACSLDLCNDNGNRDNGEACDCAGGDCSPGTQLHNKDCTDFGFDGGILGCYLGCEFDTSGCYTCNGNGQINDGEACEGTNLRGLTCQSFGFGSGTLQCSSSCQFDFSACLPALSCDGNGVAGGLEPCDGTDFRGKTCSDFGFNGGELKCNNCVIDTRFCTYCNGNNNAGETEACDGTDLSSFACEDFDGFDDTGPLTCGDCEIVTHACFVGDCNRNGVAGDIPGELCDGTDLNGKQCDDFAGKTGPGLVCDNDCQYDLSACEDVRIPYCGDGYVDPGEDCQTCPDDAGCGADEDCTLSGQCVEIQCTDPNIHCYDTSCTEGCFDPMTCYDDCPQCGSSATCTGSDTCACQECTGFQAGCLDGLLCSDGACSCVATSDGVCPADGSCDDVDPDCHCGNGLDEPWQGENCMTCPDDSGCGDGQVCLLDGTCMAAPPCSGSDVYCYDDTCMAACRPAAQCYNGCPACGVGTVCEADNSCACPECDGSQATCILGVSCDAGVCSCETTSDGVCPADGSCDDVDPDCQCGNGVIETGENCNTCPDDAGCGAAEVCQADGTCYAPQCTDPQVYCLDYDCGPGCFFPGECYDACPSCHRASVCEENDDCTCPECRGEQATCLDGLVCGIGVCQCVSVADGVCPADGSCDAVDPDCFCGNGVRDGSMGEECDDTDLNGESCRSLGYTGGALSCKDDCSFDRSQCRFSVCDNDGNQELGETCDGSDLNGATCTDFDGFAGGALGCTSDCEYNTTACYVCDNDGAAEYGEACDGSDTRGYSCSSFGYSTGGALRCTNTCQFDYSSCIPQDNCNADGLADTGESCDGSDFRDFTCADFGFTGGELRCSSSCAIETNTCVYCDNDGTAESGEACDTNDYDSLMCTDFDNFEEGDLVCDGCEFVTAACYVGLCNNNGVAETGEACDSADLRNKDCADLTGFTSGSLSCTDSCTYDTSKCQRPELPGCGDGKLDITSGEQCEGTVPTEITCEDFGFKEGTVSCRGCYFNTDACQPYGFGECGNGITETGEECDKNMLALLDCKSIGYDSGPLGCSDLCIFDVANCVGAGPGVCGDGALNTGESCDGNTNISCRDLNMEGANVSCTNGCRFNTSACVEPSICGDFKLQPGEQCDGDNFTSDCADIKTTMTGTATCGENCLLDLSSCVDPDATCGVICLADGACETECKFNIYCDPDPDCQEEEKCTADCTADDYCNPACRSNSLCYDPDCTETPVEEKGFNWIALILIILGLVCMGGSGYFLYTQYQERLQQQAAAQRMRQQQMMAAQAAQQRKSQLTPEQRAKMIEELHQKREAQKQAFQQHAQQRSQERHSVLDRFGGEQPAGQKTKTDKKPDKVGWDEKFSQEKKETQTTAAAAASAAATAATSAAATTSAVKVEQTSKTKPEKKPEVDEDGFVSLEALSATPEKSIQEDAQKPLEDTQKPTGKKQSGQSGSAKKPQESEDEEFEDAFSDLDNLIDEADE